MTRVWVVALAVPCLALAGCTERQIDDSGKALASAAPALAGDGVVFTAIESRFVAIDPSSALHVAIAVHGGRVRVTGKVRSSGVASRYRAAAKSAMSGAGDATDPIVELRVDPAIPDAAGTARDAGVVASVRAAIVAQGGVNGARVGVASHGGVVTLTGDVPTGAIRSTLVGAAQAAPGVVRVVDGLRARS